jgi:hypothetical protein
MTLEEINQFCIEHGLEFYSFNRNESLIISCLFLNSDRTNILSMSIDDINKYTKPRLRDALVLRLHMKMEIYNTRLSQYSSLLAIYNSL